MVKTVRFSSQVSEREIDQDVLPSVPSSAFYDLNITCTVAPKSELKRKLAAKFLDPISLTSFATILEAKKVLLESTAVGDSKFLKISGFVRTLSLGTKKDVRIRYTFNNWVTFMDVSAQYIGSMAPFGFSERYKFQIYANPLSLGDTLQFRIKFRADDAIYWDDFDGNNYAFDCTLDEESMALIK